MRQEEETQLWLSYREGDREAFAVIASRFYKPLLRYGIKFHVDQQVIEDSIQEVFLDLWQNRTRINATNSVKNYLFKSLRNNVIQYYRYQQRFSGEDEHEQTAVLPDEWNIEYELIERETLNELADQIKTQLSLLPEREREALYLRYYENLSVSEISEIMGVNRQSVSNFLQKALSKLRTKWNVVLSIALVVFRTLSLQLY
jgi:RNA polymerase sigma factor (sigma-70 family)